MGKKIGLFVRFHRHIAQALSEKYESGGARKACKSTTDPENPRFLSVIVSVLSSKR